MRAGTAEVYDHEIPGGQYSNLKPQARALGLEHQFELIKSNYKDVNDMLGGIVKVTPSSKVVGDMAMFLTSNDLSVQDVWENGDKLDFPDSFCSLMRGDLGQRAEGWPAQLQRAALKGEKPYVERPNAHLPALDLESEFEVFKMEYPMFTERADFISWLLYPKVFDDYYQHHVQFGDVSKIPSKKLFLWHGSK